MAITAQQKAQVDAFIASQKQGQPNTQSGLSPEKKAQVDALIAQQKTQPVEPEKSGLEKFSNTISAPFRAVSDAFFKPTVDTLSKPVGEVVASVNELQGKQAPAWTENHRLASPEIRAFQQHGISGDAAAMSNRLKQQGAEGAGFGDVLNVASLAPGGGAVAKGVETIANAEKVASGVSKFLPSLAKTVKEVAPAAAGWGAAYGAAGNIDAGKQGKGILGDTLKGAGAGLATGVGLGLAGHGAGAAFNKAESLFNPVKKSEAAVAANLKLLNQLEGNYVSLGKLADKSKRFDIDAKKMLANTDYLLNSVDREGTIHTGKGVRELESFIEPQNKVIRDNLEREGKLISINELERIMVDGVNASKITGEAKTQALNKVRSEINGLRLDADQQGNIPLTLVHDAKVFKGRHINYLDPNVAEADKLITRMLKETIENTTNSVEVKALNKELQSHYSVLELLKKLDKKKVKGGRLGKYFAQTAGAIAGAHVGGPVGSVIGAEIGGRLQGKMLQRNFSKSVGKAPRSSQMMQDAIKLSKTPKTPLLRIGHSIKPETPDTTRMLSQKEAQDGLKERGWQNVDQSSNRQMNQTAASTQPKANINDILAQLNTKEDLDQEIANRIEDFRQEAGLMADREGAGVTRRNVEDAAGNFQFQVNNFSLNKAKGAMKSQANNYKKEGMRLLYENDPDFRALVDKRDELFGQRIEAVTEAEELKAMFDEVSDEIKIAKYAEPYGKSQQK